MDYKNKRTIKNLILYKDFKALNECLDGSMEMTTQHLKLSSTSTQKETPISKSNATFRSFNEKLINTPKKFPKLPIINYNNLSQLSGEDSSFRTPNKISLSLIKVKKEDKSVNFSIKKEKEPLNKSLFTSILSNTKRSPKPKTLNYETGAKYLIPGPDSVYKTSFKIKQTVQNISSSRVKEEPPENDTETNFKVRIPLLKDLIKTKQLEKIKMFQTRKNNPNEVKIFGPTKGMSYLRRTVELQLEEPYFFLNKLYGRKEAVDQHAVLINLFNRNQEKLQNKYLTKD
jgi:hypothetical protein